MLWSKELFGVEKTIIAMLQLDAPPCDPLYRGDNDMVRMAATDGLCISANAACQNVDDALISREPLHKVSAVGQRIFCPICSVIKLGNTQSIPSISSLPAAPKYLAVSSYRHNQRFPSVKQANPNMVVLYNTSCRIDTIARKLKTADAAMVGTTFKVDGVFRDLRGCHPRQSIHGSGKGNPADTAKQVEVISHG